MLYKNDELYKMDPNEEKVLRKFFHDKFPVKVVYPSERVVKSRLKHNRLPDKPNSISFDLFAVVRKKRLPTGEIKEIPSENWRFATSVQTDKNGNKKYLPKKFKFDGTRFLTESDIDLIYFLLRKSEYCKEGDNQGKNVKFMFEDLISEADKKAEKKRLGTKINNLLFDENLSLPAAKLRVLAKAMAMKGVDELTDNQVRIHLDAKIGERKDYAEKFLSLIDSDTEIKSRLAIQDLIDKDKVVYDMQRKSWFWRTNGEGSKASITRTAPGVNAQEALVELYQVDKNFREDVNALLLTGNKNAGKEKGAKKDETVGATSGETE